LSIVFPEVHLFTCSDTFAVGCVSPYRLATMYNVTNGRTDRQTDDIYVAIADHTACNTID